jgi:hypothetical protein
MTVKNIASKLKCRGKCGGLLHYKVRIVSGAKASIRQSGLLHGDSPARAETETRGRG